MGSQLIGEKGLHGAWQLLQLLLDREKNLSQIWLVAPLFLMAVGGSIGFLRKSPLDLHVDRLAVLSSL